MQSILEIDYLLFELINSKISNPIFDVVLVGWRNKYLWLPMYVSIISFLIFNYKNKSYWIIAFFILSVASSDMISSRVIKELVERPRPCRTELLSPVVQRVPCGGGYSFTSSHATNHFAVAMFLIFTIGRYLKVIKWPLIIWAFLVGFSQIYVGVHFPSDIIFGSLLGILIAYFWARIFNNYYGYVLIRN